MKQWEKDATRAVQLAGWRQPVITGRWCLIAWFWLRSDGSDIDKRMPTLLDWLKRLLGSDDRHCWSQIAEKGIDRHRPRCEFIVIPYT